MGDAVRPGVNLRGLASETVALPAVFSTTLWQNFGRQVEALPFRTTMVRPWRCFVVVSTLAMFRRDINKKAVACGAATAKVRARSSDIWISNCL